MCILASCEVTARSQMIRLSRVNHVQCKREGFLQKIKEEDGEGCQVFGTLEVNKVAGNFHFAPGKSFQQANMHVHDLQAFQKDSFNVCHHSMFFFSFSMSLTFVSLTTTSELPWCSIWRIVILSTNGLGVILRLPALCPKIGADVLFPCSRMYLALFIAS